MTRGDVTIASGTETKDGVITIDGVDYKCDFNVDEYLATKVKFYYIKDDRIRPAGEPDPVFSFLPNNFPTEFAPPIDTDIMFEKLILDPLNRIVVACGYRPVPSTLTYASSLF